MICQFKSKHYIMFKQYILKKNSSHLQLKHIHPKLLENSMSLLRKVPENNRLSVSAAQIKLYNEFT